MAGGIGLRVEFKGARELADRLGATPRQFATAERRAVRKAGQYAKTQLIRQMAAETDIPQKAFRGWRVYASGNRIWLGHNPVKASYVGKPRKSGDDVFAGPYFFKSAFVARMKSGHVGIYRPAPNAKFRPSKTDGKSRLLPIIEQTVELPQAPGIAARVAAQTSSRLEALLRHELDVIVRGIA